MSVKFQISKALVRFFYPKLNDPHYFNFSVLKFVFWQKICRINSSVPWPVHFTSKIIEPSKIKVSKYFVPLGDSVCNYIDARNGIIVEDNVLVGPQVAIISRNHCKTDYYVYEESKPVVLRKNCWLATGCKILAGVELGEHTIVAAGAVVTRSFPEGNQLLAGNPAVVLKKLPEYTGEWPSGL